MDLEPCAGAAPEEVRRIVGVELKAGDGAAALRYFVRARCRGESVELAVGDAAEGVTLSRVLDLGAEPASARARVLALAVTELVAEVRARADAVSPPPVVEPPPPPPIARPPEPAWRWTGLAGTRTTLAAGFTSIGIGTRLARRVRWLDLAFDLVGDHGAPVASVGRIDVDTLSLGAAALVTHDVDAVALFAGPGARFGLARLRGVPAAPDRARGDDLLSPWGGPFATFGARVAPRRLVLELTGELGYALGRVDALVDGAPQVSLGGAWFGAQFGAGGAF
jgi:hypothetical protein